MKNISMIAAGMIAGLLIGFLTGKSFGYSERHNEQHSKSYGELVSELRMKEVSTINNFVQVTSSLKTVDEGGFFKVKNVSYITGTISNGALATGIKDVKLKVDYLSATSAVISSQEITVYDVIHPSGSKNFKEKVTIPEKTQRFKFTVVDLKTDEQ